ncbi:MAG: hypothetical protein ACYSTF_08330 [Planctomycetota bacterium]|jgi:serine/threonine-protein kinase
MDVIKANKAIRSAGIAAIVSGVLTVIVSVIVGLGHSIAGMSVWGVVDGLVILGLAYGIFKKSRACAVIMLVYWVACKIVYFIEGNTQGLPIAVLFAYFFLQGVIGTFTYHKETERKDSQEDKQIHQPFTPIQEQERTDWRAM